MRRLGSVILESAEATRVPAGGCLAVDRDRFLPDGDRESGQSPLD